MSFLCISLLAFPSFISAAYILPAHPRELRSAEPATWFHPANHPIHALFRQTRNGINISTDGNSYPPVGSAAWINAYPKASGVGPVNPEAMPKAWKDFLETAVNAGKIPNIPQTTLVDGTPTYPNGTDPDSSRVCSAILKTCKIEGDYWDAPIGHVALAFDDGPGPGSAKLYKFLQTKKIKATHFFIGKNILIYPQLFLTAFDILQDDLAVHTYTHPSLSTLSNEQIFAELAFTMQIIHDSTGGRVPRIFRPPFGDTDMRVHSIAKILGLTTIIWNRDTEDWRLAGGGTTQAQISSNMRMWLTDPKSPGLVMLEHELSNETAQAFINNYPLISGNNWSTVSAAQMDGLDTPYQNAKGTTGRPAAIFPNQNNAAPMPSLSRSSQSTMSWARSSSGSATRPRKSNKVNRTSTSAMPALSVAVFTSVVAWLF